jgi:hypothetical protein
MMWRGVIAVALAVTTLAACQTASTGPERAAQARASLPPAYRQMIVEKVMADFVDPYSIRDAGISAPIPGTSIMGPVATVCVRANARNRMGGYTGAQPTAYTFRDQKLTVVVDRELAQIACANAVYRPFPEIDSAARAVPSSPQARR